jgi:hypothetical protein
MADSILMELAVVSAAGLIGGFQLYFINKRLKKHTKLNN